MHTYLVLVAALLFAACGASIDSERAALGGVSAPDAPAQTEPLTTAAPDTTLSKAYFAGGCFWCTEASFERIEGVQAVVSGYSGGTTPDPTYKQVGSGQTDYAEAIAIYYDSAVVDYPTLLDVFFVAHDPTTLNRQGPDKGPQYRSAVFFSNPTEERLTRDAIAGVDASDRYPDEVVTEVTAFDTFYPAEDYHQGYYELNPGNPYVRNVSRPKVEKVEKEFAERLKEVYREGK